MNRPENWSNPKNPSEKPIHERLGEVVRRAGFEVVVLADGLAQGRRQRKNDQRLKNPAKALRKRHNIGPT